MFNHRKKKVSGRGAKVCVVLGAQWGDEGKGKLVDVLAGDVDIVARYNGGANAGHTLEVDGKKYAFHLLPCGMLHKDCLNVIGNGVVAHLPTLFEEIEQLIDADDTSINKNEKLAKILKQLVISDRAHVLLDSHRAIDGLLEMEKQSDIKNSKGAIGTTKRGIGPCYASKANRNGIRFCDLMDGTIVEKLRAIRNFQQKHYPGVSAPLSENIDGEEPPIKKSSSQKQTNIDDKELAQLRIFRDHLRAHGCVKDTVTLIHEALDKGKKLLAEGANAALLDPDFGTYPYVTSSATTIGGVCTGLSVPPHSIECIVGVVKAYTTRVGAGPFPTELDLDSDSGNHLSSIGHEYGTTTGRKRRCGWLDCALLRYSQAINGYDSVCLTKLDVLTGITKIKLGINYVLRQPPPTSPLGSSTTIPTIPATTAWAAAQQFDQDGGKLPPIFMPASLIDLAAVDVEYLELDGWNEDITSCTSFYDLPKAAQKYIRAIEHYGNLTISWVGTGPGRENIFMMPNIL
eukprot:CAMPEP_0197314778 /NCGR_PEP_ID=MMETSP0891-20130614/35170_1 /TAXON_ID=44058 ORGANISM="Aureoumbra lagunensis, Strain CCMP1510" /NCGR_SAMPLE_ID=MMETSP0891 /ASSEMBLY_ACC=CAM_ASM_000534 /LENGTH=513 /DNA_ID=CAMNT_0042803389 /DNA_START=107 /DNA_END=1648 /DNA_ORIENTATION=+